MRAFVAIFWFKVASLAGIFYFINAHKRKEYYYYRNFGLSKRKIWIPILTFDFLLFLGALALSHQIK